MPAITFYKHEPIPMEMHKVKIVQQLQLLDNLDFVHLHGDGFVLVKRNGGHSALLLILSYHVYVLWFHGRHSAADGVMTVLSRRRGYRRVRINVIMCLSSEKLQ